MTAAISTQGLTKIYGSGNTEVVAMAEVEVEVQRGEVVALLGPSGAGKSTLLMALGLLEPPTRGTIWLDGVRVVKDGENQVDVRTYRREKLGFVFQKSNLIPFLTALENVEIPMGLAGASDAEARTRSEELLEQLGVLDRRDNLPHMLSGGQQQRIAVARALANRPALLLADEPTAALDSVRGRQVMELFQEVAREHGAAVVVVTHDQRSLDVFDRILQMEDGRMVESAPDPRQPD